MGPLVSPTAEDAAEDVFEGRAALTVAGGGVLVLRSGCAVGRVVHAQATVGTLPRGLLGLLGLLRGLLLGRGLLVFPEGTRSKDGQLGTVKSGAFVVASAAGVDMVPCRILYDTPDGKMHVFCRARVCFGKPIPAAELAMGEKRDMAKLRENKQRLIAAWTALYEENRFR